MTLATIGTDIRIVLKVLPANLFPVLLFSDNRIIDTKGHLKFSKFLPARGGEQSIMPDTNKSFRKYVHAKTPEELCPNKRHDFFFFIVIVEPAKTNACFIHV